MTDVGTDLLGWASSWAAIVILFATIGVFWRLMKGPSPADRIVALDMLGILMVAFAGVFAVAAGEAAFLDVALALALVAFLGTVAFARYIERRGVAAAVDGARADGPDRVRREAGR